MKKILKFLTRVNKLKEIPRTGWVLMKVKNPEKISEHIFRVAICSWLLGKRENLNVKKLIKLTLCHDLCEVYAGDMTPLFYWDSLERKEKEDEKILLRGVRLSQKEKEKRGKIKFEKEKKSLLKLLSLLGVDLKREVFSSWLDYEKRISKEGNFVKQTDRIETLLQSIEYFGPKEVKGGTSWWEGTEEIVEEPLLLDFLEVIQKKFYGKIEKAKLHKEKRMNTASRLDKKRLEGILDFLIILGKLKEIPRRGWVLREVKNPETVASHVFTLTLAAWILGREKKSLNLAKLMKMALCHAIPKAILGDFTPYDKILENKTQKRKKAILKKWIRLSKKEKAENFLREYKKERKVMKKITGKLDEETGKEVFQLWREFKLITSPEGYFLNQIDVFTTLLQAFQYWQRDKSLPIESLWEWAFETCDNLSQFKILEELKKEYERNC